MRSAQRVANSKTSASFFGRMEMLNSINALAFSRKLFVTAAVFLGTLHFANSATLPSGTGAPETTDEHPATYHDVMEIADALLPLTAVGGKAVGTELVQLAENSAQPPAAPAAKNPEAARNNQDIPATESFQRGTAAVEKGNYQEALANFRKAAELGHANAQSDLGNMYLYGLGVERDDAEAVRWYRKAAEQGLSYGQSNLGSAYLNGRGVTRDYTEALRWFRKAAEQGLGSAQANLGFMYQNGHGVKKDDAEAVRWYRKAADQGLDYAQLNLGLMYQNGRGVKRDLTEAVRWMRIAAEQGNETAQETLKKLGK